MPLDEKTTQDLVAIVSEVQPTLEKLAAQETEISKLAPAIVDNLIKAGELDANKREAAIKNMSDPVKVAHALLGTSASLATAKDTPKPMGGGTEKQSTAQPSNKGPFTRGKADEAYLKGLGLI